MGIVKSCRAIGRFAGKAIDKDDRELLGRFVIYIGGGATILVAGAGAIGLAVRIFGIAAG